MSGEGGPGPVRAHSQLDSTPRPQEPGKQRHLWGSAKKPHPAHWSVFSTPVCTGLPAAATQQGSTLPPFPVLPTLPGAEAPSTLRPQLVSQALARTPGRAPRECGQPGQRPPTSGPLCWPHPGANASGSHSTAGSQRTQVSPNLQPASQPSCLLLDATFTVPKYLSAAFSAHLCPPSTRLLDSVRSAHVMGPGRPSAPCKAL